MNTNCVVLVGNLGTDPEFREFTSGKSKAQFSLAFKTLGSEDANWITVECWNGIATNVEKYLTKGSKVCVTGSLKYESWTGSDQVRRSAIKLVANNVEFLSTKRPSDEAPVETGYAGELLPY